VPKDQVFIHGKAGVVELADRTKTCFSGSSKSAFAHNYEIVWEDPSPEGVAWVRGCVGGGGIRRAVGRRLPVARRHRRGDRADHQAG